MVWWWLIVGACTPDDDVPDPEVIHLEPVEGNPLVPHAPLYPWPSDLYLVDDATTATGRRVEIPEDVLPPDVPGPILNDDDGFTRAPAILAWLDGGVDPTSLPDLAGSIQDDSPVLVLREGDFAPVPVLVELDGNVSDPNVQALIVRPQRSLDADTGYVVVLRDTLRKVDGGTHTAGAAFRALRDGVATDDPVVESMRDDFELLRDALDARDIEPESVVLGWTFHTRSEADVVAGALHMQDVAASVALPDWTLVSDTHDGANRLVVGTFDAPDFLGPEGVFTLEQGVPVQKGTREVEFLLTIPDTVDEPRPVILFGHGFFSAKEETTWGSLQHSLQPWRFSTASVDFIGFNEDDLLTTAAGLGGDLVAMERIVQEQLQSHVHFTLLARLVKEELYTDFDVFDPARVHYMGISNGGSQGSVILATSPVLDRGALVVPGGAWSHMLQRAVQWRELGGILELKHPDPLELQLVVAMTQQVLDPADIVNYARGLVTEPFPGRTANEVTLHMAVGDSQVANMVTEWVARDAGIPIVTPAGRTVFGLDEVDASPPGRTDLASALLVYDEGYPPQPEGNVPPYTDNGAHESIRYLDAYTEQVGAFLETGTIVQVCEGACDPD